MVQPENDPRNVAEKLGIIRVLDHLTTWWLESHGGYSGDWIIIGDQVVVLQDADKASITQYSIAALQSWQNAASKMIVELRKEGKEAGDDEGCDYWPDAIMNTHPEEPG